MFIGVLMAALLFEGCASSKKTAEPFNGLRLSATIDGSDEEWKSATFKPSREPMLFYAVANDNKNIYVCLRIPEGAQQMKALRAGIELALDIKAKRSRKAFMAYPWVERDARNLMKEEEQSTEQIQRGRSKPIEKPNAKEIGERMLENQKVLMVKGFKEDFNGEQDITFMSGFVVKIGWNANNFMIYEAALPLEALNMPENTEVEKLSVGITVKGLPMPKGSAGPNPMPMGGGAMGGGMGGGMQPGMMGGGAMGGGMMPGGGMRGMNRQMAASGSDGSMSFQTMMRDQTVWERYGIK
jgi:hypothetical protein